MEVFNKTAGNNGQSQPFLNDRTIWITGAATGLLFGLHPLHVESVAWVAERKDLLCAFFFLLTIGTYTNYVSEVNASASINSSSRFFNKKYLLAIGFFILSLLSKPMAVTLPFVLLILDWYPFRRIQSFKTLLATFIEKLPFIVLSFISSILIILAHGLNGAIISLEEMPLSSRVLVATKSLTVYLGKMMLPINLVPFYPFPENIFFYSLEYIIPIVIVIAITVACISVVRNQKLWMSVWSYYVITLIPVLGIVHVGSQSMADRFTYLPSLGPFLIIGLISAKVNEKVTALNWRRGMIRMASFIIAIAMLVSISYTTIKQIGIWKNSVIFWNYIIEKEPSRFPFPYNNLGEAYESNGQLDMAIKHYQAALRLKPDYAEAYNNLGTAYQSQGLYGMAIEHYQSALRLKPDYAKAHYNLGNAYMSHGLIDLAIEQFQSALRLNPDYAEAYNNLGNVYLAKGQFDIANEQYQAALRLNPDFAETHCNLGNVYLSKGLVDMAIEQYRIALRLQPNLARAYVNLGIAYRSLGRFDMAIEQHQAALRLNPDYAEAHNNLGLAYKSKGQFDMAIEQFQAALRLKPDFAEAHFNLGSIYLNNGSKDMAKREFELGLKNKPNDFRARQVLNSIIKQSD